MTPYCEPIQAALPEAKALLRDLVNLPSGSYDTAGVNAVGNRLASEWARLGFDDRRIAIPDRGDMRILTRRFAGGQGRLMILGHLDTVWPREDIAGWGYSEDETMAYGPGVGDMKGGLVMAWLAVRALVEQGARLPAEIACVLVPDEEIGSPGSRAHIEREAQASDWVLVLEPARPGGEVIVGRNAVGAMIVTARGRTAHVAVNPENGISALLPLARMTPMIDALSRPEAGLNAMVGVLRAGSARQVVPDLAEMHIDLRAPDEPSAQGLETAIRTMARQAERDHPGVTITVSGGVTRPAFPRAVGEGLYALYGPLARAAGISAPAVTTRGGSDGSFGAALGVATLDGLGPVCFGTCSRQEHIVLSSLPERAELFAGLIAVLSDQARPSAVA